MSTAMDKTQVQMNQRPQHKSSYNDLLEEKVGGTLEQIGIGDRFLNITPVAQTLSSTINKRDFLKLRSVCQAKDTVDKTKWQPPDWENIFTNLCHIWQRADLQNIQRTQESSQQNTK